MDRRCSFPQREARKSTLSALVERQLVAVKLGRPRDYESQRVVLNWWRVKLGGYSLAVLAPDLPSRLRDPLQTKEALSNATVNGYFSFLNETFSSAVTEWRLLAANPLEARPQAEEVLGSHALRFGCRAHAPARCLPSF